MNNYIKRKKLELKELSRFLDKKSKLQIKVKTKENLIIFKEKLIKEIRENNARKYYHPLTNNSQLFFKNKYFKYTYTYERFNGFIEIEDFVLKFYKIKGVFKNNTYFSNSGMSAIVSLLTSFVLESEVNVDLMYSETYFETIKFLNMITKTPRDKKALYIDSIASDFVFSKIHFNNYEYIIIDTTCYKPEDFSKYIQNILNRNIPCILVRSHTKLDLLSTEFSHIGSISFLYPANLNHDSIKKLQKIEIDCRHLIGVYGACLPPEKFPEFMIDKNIIKLNDERLSIVQRNNEIVYKKLINNNINVTLPNHKQFCLIFLKKTDYKLAILKKKIIDFCNRKSPYYIKHAVSFGFDYISIDVYQNFIDNTFKIRVCISDLPECDIDLFVKDFIDFFNKLDYKEE